MKKILFLFLALMSSISCAKECHSLAGWQGYFAERLDKLDPIEGIYNVQFTRIANGSLSQNDGDYAIARFSGNFFRIYGLDGQQTDYYIQRIGNTKYYYLTYISNKGILRARFSLNTDGTFEQRHTFTDEELISFGIPMKANVAFNNSGVKYFPDANTQKTQLEASIWCGSCFSLGSGYIATNYHVIDNAALNRIYVDEQEKACYTAQIIATDPINDLAILKIDDESFIGSKEVPYNLKREKSDVGEECFILGYPWPDVSGRELKYENGTINALSGFQGDPCVYQISAPADYGNSGGPTFDRDGNIIGILNSGIQAFENLTYCIKASYLLNLLETNGLENLLSSKTMQKGLDRVELIKTLRKYVYFIECTNSESWDVAIKKAQGSPYIWELPENLTIERKEVKEAQISADDLSRMQRAKETAGHVYGEITEECLKSGLTFSLGEQPLQKYGKSLAEVKKRLFPYIEVEFYNSSLFHFDSSESVKADFHIIEVDQDGEIYGLLIFSKNKSVIAEVYLNGDGSRDESVLENSVAAVKEAAKNVLKDITRSYKKRERESNRASSFDDSQKSVNLNASKDEIIPEDED